MQQNHNRSCKILSLAALLTMVLGLMSSSALAAENTNQTDGEVDVTVSPYITLDVSTDTVNVSGSTNVKTGNFNATVTSNKAYKLFISASSGFTADLSSASGGKIETISTESSDLSGLTTAAWGIKCASNNCANKNYKGIAGYTDGQANQTTLFYTSNGAEDKQRTDFEVGVFVGSISSGTYTGQILITAAQV